MGGKLGIGKGMGSQKTVDTVVEMKSFLLDIVEFEARIPWDIWKC